MILLLILVLLAGQKECVVVSIQASSPVLMLYKISVITFRDFGTKIDHDLLPVGHQFWHYVTKSQLFIKNSWCADWNGYARIFFGGLDQ